MTASAGTVVSVTPGVSLVVKGSLATVGSAASHVIFNPATAGMSWGGIIVQSGGSLDLAYTDVNTTNVPLTCNTGTVKCKADHTAFLGFTGVGMSISTSAVFSFVEVASGGSDGISAQTLAADTISITDSKFHTTGGDAIVMNGAGNLTFDHNHVYATVAGATPGQHCACHFNSTGTFLVTFNDFEGSTVGFMASQMNAASKVNNNNFITNTYATSDGTGVNAGASLINNYWGGGAPPAIMGNSNTTPFSTTKIAGTGPR